MSKARNLAWIDKHFEEVVEPKLKKKDVKIQKSFSNADLLTSLGNYNTTMFTGDNLIGFFFMWAVAVEKAKRLNKQILLPGRDAYLFAVLSEIAGHGAIVRPDISTTTSPFIAEDYTNTLMVDSGYSGTCAAHMKIPDFILVSCNKQFRQIYRPQKLPFGNIAPTSYAPTMEGCPKYWNRAFMEGDPTNQSYIWEASFSKSPTNTLTKEQYFKNRNVPMISKGSPIKMMNSSDEIILKAFYMHRFMAEKYTPEMINAMREAAINWLDNDKDWATFLAQRSVGQEKA